jgi:hypothetical protein
MASDGSDDDEFLVAMGDEEAHSRVEELTVKLSSKRTELTKYLDAVKNSVVNLKEQKQKADNEAKTCKA